MSDKKPAYFISHGGVSTFRFALPTLTHLLDSFYVRNLRLHAPTHLFPTILFSRMQYPPICFPFFDPQTPQRKANISPSLPKCPLL